MSDESVEIAVELLHQTTRAYKVTDGDREAWIPISQIEDEHWDGETLVSIVIPAWLAEREGLV